MLTLITDEFLISNCHANIHHALMSRQKNRQEEIGYKYQIVRVFYSCQILRTIHLLGDEQVRYVICCHNIWVMFCHNVAKHYPFYRGELTPVRRECCCPFIYSTSWFYYFFRIVSKQQSVISSLLVKSSEGLIQMFEQFVNS